MERTARVLADARQKVDDDDGDDDEENTMMYVRNLSCKCTPSQY